MGLSIRVHKSFSLFFPRVGLCVALLLLVACEDKATEAQAKNQLEHQVSTSSSDVEGKLLFDFESAELPAEISFYNSTGALVKTTAVNGQVSSALKVNFNSSAHEYTSILINPKEFVWDWSELGEISLAFDIRNQGEHSVQLFLDAADTAGNSFTRSVNVPAGTSRVYYAKLSGHDMVSANPDSKVELNAASGLRGNPPTWEGDDVQFIWMWGVMNLDVSSIKQIALSVQYALHDKEVILDNIRVIKNPPMNTAFLTKIVDKYGQSAKIDFPGKIHSDAQLAEVTANELKDLKDGESLADRSTFGGWKKGPKQEARGFFYPKKVDGKWWLVDPEGYLYFATGLDIIRLANAYTMTGYDYDPSTIEQRSADDLTPEDSKGKILISEAAQKTRHLVSKTRADMFEWLPEHSDPLGNHYDYNRDAHSGPLKKGEAFSFYSANLERKYGETEPESYLRQWEKVTVDRMLNWGFTSLGNWTDPKFYNNQRIPYFANGWIIGNFKKVSSGNDFWGGLPDPFDPLFKERALVTAKAISEDVNNSPWCVGVFIDNEKSWGRSESKESEYGIVLNTLTRDGAESPTKNRFTQLMKEKYSTIDALNSAWGLSLASWDEFQKGIKTGINNDVQLADFSLLFTHYAEEYFRIVEGALSQYLPNHMYLGVRFADWGMPKDVVKASAKYADVVSYNFYKEGLTGSKWKFLEELDKPSIIGEFHVGTTESGLFHPGLVHAGNQQDRAKMYKEYMQTVVDNPYFIGAHWFQYMDSPVTGRSYDGENYNVGFVTVTDTPYEPMVKAAKELHSEMYERRANK
ncbi:beta-galactosidase [Cellvibrio sp. ARAG 10.3]|uniref:beta-galactosidase n=1 Tax=Cellvibrio sp. ARAG 10.3 TaxID=3451358 RepID=UPI003F46C797